MRRYLLLGVVLCTAGFGATLAERKAQKEFDDRANQQLTEMKTVCGGGDVKLEIDWNTFKGALDESNDKSKAASYCFNTTDTLTSLCRNDADAKVEIAKKLKKIVCKFNKDAQRAAASTDEDKKRVANCVIKGDTMTYTFMWDTSTNYNGVDPIKDCVMNSL